MVGKECNVKEVENFKEIWRFARDIDVKGGVSLFV